MMAKSHKMLLFAIFWCLQLAFAQNTNSEWRNKKADVCFMLDSSSSIWIVDYGKMLKFVSDLVGDMDIGVSATKVGLSLFSDNHVMVIPLNNSYSKEQLQTRITQAPYLKGDTYISRALKGLREQCLSRAVTRPDVPQIAVLVTDGMSRHKQLTADNATLVKQSGISLFTLGVGNSVDPEELRMIASDPKTDYYYHVTDFNSLNDIRVQLSTKMSQVDRYQGDAGKCGTGNFDTVFVYDETAIGDVNTKKIKKFIENFVKKFSLNSGIMRIGIVSKTCHEGDILLGQYVTDDKFLEGLNHTNGPEISKLLNRARTTAFLPENGARGDTTKQRIILIMHSNGLKQSETRVEAVRAKYAGIEIFVIYLGTDYNKTFINSLVSNVNFAFFRGSADDLTNITLTEEFMKRFCEEY